MGHKYEIFSAGCNLCKNAIEILRNNICEKCEIIEYNLQDPIKEEIQEKIEKYDIRAVPSINIDEEHKIVGIPKPDEINKIFKNTKKDVEK
ncbi:MAG: thioredoxin family protein [Candidatus Hodarchaeota archaeon]